MAQAQQLTQSLWQETTHFSLPTLTENIQTEVCIIGAGISGLTTAYLCAKKGLRVVVIDKEPFGQNETGFTTAHISNALDEGYAQLEKWHGRHKTQLAFESHTEAIRLIEQIVQNENIECDFQHVDGYLFLGPEQSREDLQKEMEACHRAQFLDVELVAHAPEMLFTTGPCLRFPRQAQFHPLKYLQGLVRAIQSLGGYVYGQTKATEISGDPLTYVETAQGYRISCEHIVVATNVPVNDRVTMHTKEAAYRSYAIGFKVPKQTQAALFWDTADPYHYIRFQSLPDENFDVLIVGGEDHRVGQEQDPEKRFYNLESWAQLRLGVSSDVVFRWSGQIIEPMDGLAFIGRNPGDKDNVYIATGDSGHGITHGTIAGMLLSDLIDGEANPWEELYSPRRVTLKCLGEFARENFKGAKSLADWLTPGQVQSREDLLPGEGAIFNEGLSKIAVYRDEHGQYHEFSASCPHLKAVVQWNSSEQTWDCPFHGSRFSRLGEVLNGPAISDLSPKIPAQRAPEWDPIQPATE